MAITLIRRLDAARSPSDTGRRSSTLLSTWHRRAHGVGQCLALRQCASEDEAARAVREAQAQRAELIVVETGRAAPDGALARALADAAVPYVELHADDGRAPEPTLPAGPRRVGLVQGYGGQGLELALWIAFERLNLEPANDDYRVGT